MNDQGQLEYRGYGIQVQVREPVTESNSGILLSTTTIWPIEADGRPGVATTFEKNYAGIYFDETSARDAAVKRARHHIDKIFGD